MPKRPKSRRYYRSLQSVVHYWCPVRKCDTWAFHQYGNNLWIDMHWVKGEDFKITAIPGTDGGFVSVDANLKWSYPIVAMEEINQWINQEDFFVEPLIDQSRDNFDITYGVGSYEISIKAARQAMK